MGIYERIQQKELKSNEDHVTYVTKVEKSIVGMKTVSTHNLAGTHSSHSPHLPHCLLFCIFPLFPYSSSVILSLRALMNLILFLQTLSSLLSHSFLIWGESPWPEFTVSGVVTVCPIISLQVLPASAGRACQCTSNSSAAFQTSMPCEGVGNRRQSDRKQFHLSVSNEFLKDYWC